MYGYLYNYNSECQYPSSKTAEKTLCGGKIFENPRRLLWRFLAINVCREAERVSEWKCEFSEAKLQWFTRPYWMYLSTSRPLRAGTVCGRYAFGILKFSGAGFVLQERYLCFSHWSTGWQILHHAWLWKWLLAFYPEEPKAPGPGTGRPRWFWRLLAQVCRVGDFFSPYQRLKWTIHSGRPTPKTASLIYPKVFFKVCAPRLHVQLWSEH